MFNNLLRNSFTPLKRGAEAVQSDSQLNPHPLIIADPEELGLSEIDQIASAVDRAILLEDN